MSKIIAHTLVRNEQNWVWYALNSVISYVDEILVWDTGSTDHTVEVIKSIKSPKLKFRQLEVTVDEIALSAARTQMIKESNADWILVLDGDEVWLDKSIKNCVDVINTTNNLYESIVVPTLNCVGDVYHVMPTSAGKYTLAGRTGHLNTRFVSTKIPGLHVANPAGELQSYFDEEKTKVQDRDQNKILYLDSPYMHMTHLARSNIRANETNVFWRAGKRKVELGVPLPNDFPYPSVFFLPTPQVVPSPWTKRSIPYLCMAAIQTPLKVFKRQFLK